MPSTIRSAVLAALAGAASVSAHGHVTEIAIDGKTYTGFDPTSQKTATGIAWSNGASDNGFVKSSQVSTADVICHLSAANAPETAPATAGSNVTITWNTWPESHKGPVIDYLADCGDDCATVDKSTLKWFKISELGQISLGSGSGSTGKWADDLIIENGFTWSAAIPATIKPGNYVWRHELIALHEGQNEGSAQLYPQCFNIEISGSGTVSPEGVIGTELYTATDPGILHNIYNDESLSAVTDYIIPGPALPDFGASSGGSASAPAVSSTASSSVAAQPTTATTAPATTAPATTPVAATPVTPTVTQSSVAESAATTVPVSSSPAAPTQSVHCGSKKRRSRRHAREIKNVQ
ncbi:lytic polysaccharide monooxygenase [Biscogniauxia marginata]|nr:lytic polysaccharide monooxygenase [Biscogniauxia marginata]